MKHFRHIILGALAIIAAGACSVKEESMPESSGIRFTTNLDRYVTKATDTNFENGDAVSLFVDWPVEMYNVKMTFDGKELVPEVPVMWAEDQDPSEMTTFLAVYPYKEDWNAFTQSNAFSVNADQSTHELYTASDLMGASYMAYSDCQTVPLNFTHVMSRLKLHINYEKKGEDPIKEVYLSDVYGKARVGLTHQISAGYVGERGTIKMGRIEKNVWDGDKYSDWVAIVPPQPIDYKILVVTESGNQYTYAMEKWSNYSYMEKGWSYDGSMSIDSYAEATDVSLAVSEWTDDNDLQFGRFVPDEFHTEGSWALRGYNPETGQDEYRYFSFGSNGILQMYFDNREGGTYELMYQNGVKHYVYGFEGDTSSPKPNGVYPVVAGGTPVSFESKEELVLELNPYEMTLSVRPDNDVWSLIGNLYEDNWDMDYPMVRDSAAHYSIEFEYRGGEFKLRCNGSWDVNLGGSNSGWFPLDYSTMPIGNGYRFGVSQDGSNMSMNTAGLYKIELDLISQRIVLRLLENYSSQMYGNVVGTWNYQIDDETSETVTISTSDNGGYELIIEDEAIQAEFDGITGGFTVKFQWLNQWYYDGFGGTLWDAFYGILVDEEGGTHGGVYGGDDTDVVLFSGRLSEDGESIEISPGTANGYTFGHFTLVTFVQDGDYAGGVYYLSGTEYPLPAIWTRVSE